MGRRFAVGFVVLALCAVLVQPALAAPCPWGTNCITVTQVTPTANATLSGTVALEARAVQDQPAERGDIVNVEWWLYHPSFAAQVPGNAEAKILLDESSTPSSGTVLNGTWTGSWTVTDTLTTRDGWYDSPGERTYELPADDGQYVLEAHVLDEEWQRTWGGPPGRSAPVPVTIDFSGGGSPPPDDPDPDPDPGDPGDGEVNIGGLNLPTSVAVLPSGRVYVSEKGGTIRTAPSLFAASTTAVRTVSTYTNGDHGLQSLAYHPNGHLYAAYTRQPTGYCDPADYGQDGRGCVVYGQVSRFLVNADGSLGPEQSIRGGPGSWCAQFTTHGIDDIEVGPDGAIYVSAGDGAGFTGADTGQFDGDPCGGNGALRAQSTSNLAGNVVRMNATTGATTTVAHGFRNPYRISFQPGTSTLFVGDVGWYTAEEINRVSTSGPVTNHGWPCREGTGPMSFYAGLSACSGVTGTAPIFSYAHDGANAAVSAVGFHGGRVYYGDYHRRFIRSIAPDGSGDRAEASDVMPVDLESTSAGLIYVDIGRGAVRRVGGTGEAPPASPPFAEVVVAERPWTPGEAISYAVDYRNFGRQPVQVQWTITRGDGSVVATETATPAGPDGRHSGTVTAPAATYPASLTFTAVVTNATGARVEVSQSRQMAAPADPVPDPDPDPDPDPQPGPNLMPNPSLEAGSGSLPSCWFQGGWGTSGTWSRVGDAHDGSFAHRVSISGYTSGDRKLLPSFTSACAPAVTPGETYDLSAYYTSTSPSVAFVGFTRDAATGSWDYWFSSPSQPTAATWRQARATTPPVPAGVDRISWGLALYGNGTLTTDSYRMTATSGSVPDDPAPDPDPDPDPEPDPDPDPDPDPPAPGTNLVNNPSLEQATGGIPTCWLQGGWGSNTRSWARVGTAHSGAAAHRLTVGSYVNGDGKLVQDFTSACAPTVTPGATYVLSAQYTSTAPTFFIGFARSASTGAWSYWFEGGSQPASASYRQATLTTPPVPAGADRISWGLALASNGQLTTDTYVMTPTTTSGSGGVELLRAPAGVSTAAAGAPTAATVGLATSDTADPDGPPPPMPPPDTDAPTLQIDTPRSLQRVSGVVDLQVSVGDRVGVREVTATIGRGAREMTLDPDGLAGFDTRTLANGRHRLTVVATDVNGNATTATRDLLVHNRPVVDRSTDRRGNGRR